MISKPSALLAACMLCFAMQSAKGQPTNSLIAKPSPAPKIKAAAASNSSPTNSVSQDDLEWLVGRWHCVVRQYLSKRERPLGGPGEDALEYFNVYFPYADDRLTLNLTKDPNDRPIAAEFIVRSVAESGEFGEALMPMPERGPVRIGKNRILYGNAPFEDYEFHYVVEKRGRYSWLILDSKYLHLELFKLSSPLGDISKSWVLAPIVEYTPEQIAVLKRRYSELKAQARKESR